MIFPHTPGIPLVFNILAKTYSTIAYHSSLSNIQFMCVIAVNRYAVRTKEEKKEKEKKKKENFNFYIATDTLCTITIP
jgi:putative effector of murein hydrolase LrgA (UPF0299 family)